LQKEWASNKWFVKTNLRKSNCKEIGWIDIYRCYLFSTK